MKLSREDQELLRSLECEERDFPQIERALRKDMTTYKLEKKRISREQAIELLGKRDFLSGISRSAFHCTAVRKTADGRFVRFNSYNLFK